MNRNNKSLTNCIFLQQNKPVIDLELCRTIVISLSYLINQRKLHKNITFRHDNDILGTGGLGHRCNGGRRDPRDRWDHRGHRGRQRGDRVDRRTLEADIQRRLLRSGDVETNPGPAHDIGETKLITLNVRGLNDTHKLRHLINYCNKEITGCKNFIGLFQETFIEKEGLIPFLWRGNYVHTAGTGNSLGCVTLLSHHLSVVETKTIDRRGHIIACQSAGSKNVSYIVANIYAPNPNNAQKMEFFNEVINSTLELCERYQCYSILLGGDFNLVLKSSETKNRSFSPQERRVAEELKTSLTNLGLKDIWSTGSEFTWRRPNTDVMSTIDRIIYNPAVVVVESINVDWSITMSDHAAIIIKIKGAADQAKSRVKIPRLDPSLLSIEHVKSKTDGKAI